MACSISTDTIVITPSIMTPVSMALSAATSGSLAVAMFTLSSKSCLQSDIIYSASITADSTQNLSFITFNTVSLIIAWTVPT